MMSSNGTMEPPAVQHDTEVKDRRRCKQGRRLPFKRSIAIACMALCVFCIHTVLTKHDFPEARQMNSDLKCDSSTGLAYKESFGFFDYIPDSDWKFRQHLARTRIDFTENPNQGLANPKIWYLEHYYPSFSCPGLLRVSRNPTDGPKFVCDPHRLPHIAEKRKKDTGDAKNGCLVYSIGSLGNYEFEDGLVDLIGTDVCEIHVFDPSRFGETTDRQKYFHLHKWGLKGSYDESYKPMVGGKFLTIQETVKELGHENRVIDLFKVDCEDCEWYSYKDWLQLDIRQILVETHNTPEMAPAFFEDILNAGYVITSKEPNIHPAATRDNLFSVEWNFLKLHPDFSKRATSEALSSNESTEQKF